MQKIVALATMALTIAVAACSPQSNQGVSPNVAKESEQIPESQQEGYMRFIGDLKWTSFKTPQDLLVQFPKCSKVYPSSTSFYFYDIMSSSEKVRRESCGRFSASGIDFYLGGISFSDSLIPQEGFIFIPDTIKMQKFYDAITTKYGYNEEEWVGGLGNAFSGINAISCSKYTCFEFSVIRLPSGDLQTHNNYFKIYSTGHTLSIMAGGESVDETKI